MSRHGGVGDYSHRILNSRPIAYWPMWDKAHAGAEDISGYGHDGVYTGVTLAQVGIGDGKKCPSFDGATSLVNAYSAGLVSQFSGVAGTAAIWAKMTTAALTDAAPHYAIYFLADADNFFSFYKTTTNNLLAWDYKANTTAEQGTVTVANTNWHHYAITWSDAGDRVCYYTDGAVADTADTGVGTWAGNLSATDTTIGAATTTPTSPWLGNLAHCAIWARALTASDIAEIYKVS